MQFKFTPQLLALGILLPITINAAPTAIDAPREPGAVEIQAEVRDPAIVARAEDAANLVKDSVTEAEAHEIEARKGGGGRGGGGSSSGGSKYTGSGGSHGNGDDEGAAGHNAATAGLAMTVSALVAAGLLTV